MVEEFSDVVLLRDLPEKGLRAGDVGVVVEVFAGGSTGAPRVHRRIHDVDGRDGRHRRRGCRRGPSGDRRRHAASQVAGAERLAHGRHSPKRPRRSHRRGPWPTPDDEEGVGPEE